MAKEKKKKSLQKVVTRQRVQAAIMFVLGLLLLNQTIQFYRYKDELAFIDTLEERNSEVIQELSESEQYLSLFGEDLNSIRQFLLLPTKDYEFGDEEVVLSEEDSGEDLTTELFTFVEKLGTYEKNQDRYDANLAAFQSALKETYWGEKGLSVDSAGTASSDAQVFSFKNAAGTELFSVSLGYDGLFTLSAIDTDWKLQDNEKAEYSIEEIRTFVDSDLAELQSQVQALADARASVSTLIASQQVQTALKTASLSVSAELGSPETYYYEIKNRDSEMVAKLIIQKEGANKSLQLLNPQGDYDEEVALGEDAATVLVDALANGVDGRTETQKLVEEHKKEIESVFADRAFKAVLQEMGLQMGASFEDDARISYPLLRGDGQMLRTIYIDKVTGEVKVELPDGQESQTLSMAIQAIDLTGKKKLSTPQYC